MTSILFCYGFTADHYVCYRFAAEIRTEIINLFWAVKTGWFLIKYYYRYRELRKNKGDSEYLFTHMFKCRPNKGKNKLEVNLKRDEVIVQGYDPCQRRNPWE